MGNDSVTKKEEMLIHAPCGRLEDVTLREKCPGIQRDQRYRILVTSASQIRGSRNKDGTSGGPEAAATASSSSSSSLLIN